MNTAASLLDNSPQNAASRGFFISFEGIDGAGKSTHIAALAEELRARSAIVTTTREPGGTATAERLREMLLHEEMDALSELLLMFAARREHLTRVIAPALAAAQVVLCDRFTDASFAYQGGGRGMDWQVLNQLAQWVQTLEGGAWCEPHLTLWFDLPPAIAAARLANARSPDKFESQSEAFFQRVQLAYARRAAENPARILRIEANQEPAAVWHELLPQVIARLPTQ